MSPSGVWRKIPRLGVVCAVEDFSISPYFVKLLIDTQVELGPERSTLVSALPAVRGTKLPELMGKGTGRRSRRDAELGGGAGELAGQRLRWSGVGTNRQIVEVWTGLRFPPSRGGLLPHGSGGPVDCLVILILKSHVMRSGTSVGHGGGTERLPGIALYLKGWGVCLKSLHVCKRRVVEHLECFIGRIAVDWLQTSTSFRARIDDSRWSKCGKLDFKNEARRVHAPSALGWVGPTPFVFPPMGSIWNRYCLLTSLKL